ncbi:uncharacterized protein LOC131149086 [Malania oleifera]|uniref:uncharacterized protein LOC131149086 n=1 Tax=Malania oleifera TaxID=397392 RepID=UPI0025ADA8F9|nr:uncharacterized protein LOC131149086 [Malania oleifera]
MKFLTPSSSISSASAAAAAPLDRNLSSPKSDAFGCLAGVIRRLLCSGSVPTYPSDHIKEAPPLESGKLREWGGNEEKMEAPATPGIVARLMGLESIPDRNSGSTQTAPNSIARSRSMNSADRWGGSAPEQGMHRRVKTSSSSFREMPAFFELENEEFFLLSFESKSETKEVSSKRRKSEVGFGELKQRKTERSKKKDDRAAMVAKKEEKEQEISNKASSEKENSSRIISHEPSKISPNSEKLKDSDEAKLREKRNKNCSKDDGAEAESSSENSSPVSVLDCGEFLSDFKVHSSGEDSRLAISNPRRKLSTELEDDFHGGSEVKEIEGKFLTERKKERQKQDCSSMWDEICKLIAGDMMGSNWAFEKLMKLEDFEDVGVNLGLQVLDQLLEELVDQLVN